MAEIEPGAQTGEKIVVARDSAMQWRWRWWRGGNVIAGPQEGYVDQRHAVRMAKYVRGPRLWIRVVVEE